VAVLIATGPAGATPRDVTAPDFPGVGQIAEILPAYAGGNRTIENDHAVWVYRADCQSYEEGPGGHVRKFAYYYAPDSTQPSFPNIRVQEFGSVAGAKQAIRTIRAEIERCYGTIREPRIDGVFIRRSAEVPALGDGRPVAWKLNDHWTDGRGDEHDYYSRRVWMREGETIIGIDLWGDVPQSRAASIELAELALETVD
jgi:hypothetical protein